MQNAVGSLRVHIGISTTEVILMNVFEAHLVAAIEPFQVAHFTHTERTSTIIEYGELGCLGLTVFLA